jgi:hypothetical protein
VVGPGRESEWVMIDFVEEDTPDEPELEDDGETPRPIPARAPTPLPTSEEALNERIHKKLFTEGFDLGPGGLVALLELVELPHPVGSVSQGLDIATMTLAEGFFGAEGSSYEGFQELGDYDETREIVAQDFLDVFEEVDEDGDFLCSEEDIRLLVPLLLLITGRALEPEEFPPATHAIMQEFWAELDIPPDGPTADVERVSTWYYQSRLPHERLLTGLRRVLKHYQP